jgi:1,4-alpha-glucan branching enzyme
MSFSIRLHYDNRAGFDQPYLWIWYEGLRIQHDFAPIGEDSFGFVYDCSIEQQEFWFKFKEGPGTTGPWEVTGLDRYYRPLERSENNVSPNEIWCKGDKPFVYHVEPVTPQDRTAEDFLKELPFKVGIYLPESGGLSGLGANLLEDGRVLFGFYHPNAARVSVTGSFNNWDFAELKLYRGWFGVPNTWLVVVDGARVRDEYKFCVQGGVPGLEQLHTDPYARQLGGDFNFNNAVVSDPASFEWSDQDWTTPEPHELILYEMSVYGFTQGDPDVQERNRGKFRGVTERIEGGYFERLGITTLSLMPVAEVPSMQGPRALGYDPSLFFAIERDFGSPDDLRELVDAAHKKGLAVLIDQVFNHTSNDFNPLWKMCLEHPGQETDPEEGGLYFGGTTRWGNRIATEKLDVQNMLIDVCKLFLAEYHVDGFRFDATHHDDVMDFGFLVRLARELKAFKPGVLLIAENLPNQADLNPHGYAQWCNQFHDKIKALLREGQFEGQTNTTDNLGDAFYFSKQSFASHTDNVINYCYSHDENSVAQELNETPMRDDRAAKDRKGRLGLFATMVALGQPMIYMGQEFNIEQESNIVTIDWPQDLETDRFFQWSSRLIKLRGRYPGLKLRGDDPASTGKFVWILGPWLAPNLGGDRKVVGWRSHPNQSDRDTLIVMLNFETHAVEVDVELGIPGTWLKLADVEQVNDVPPDGSNSVHDPTALRTTDGRINGFTLPSSSGFIYKWEAPD